MASFLKIKPTRKEILELVSRQLQAQRQQRVAELHAQVEAIQEQVQERVAKWEAECAEVATIESTKNEQLRQLRKQAKKLGLQEESTAGCGYQISPDAQIDYDVSVIRFKFTTTVVIPIDRSKMPPKPTETAEEKRQLDAIRQKAQQYSRRYIDPSCIVAYLVDDNAELLQEIEEVAKKIQDGIENQSVKLLEGCVE